MTMGWIEFDLPDDRLAGFAFDSAQAAQSVQVETQGFYTADDGPKLYTLLDQIYRVVLRHGTQLPPELIKLALVNIKGKRARMLLNPSAMQAFFVTKRGVEMGQEVCLDDLADVVSLRFQDIELPTEGSLIFIFQQQWRHALYFDFTPAHDSINAPPRPLGDVGSLLGFALGCSPSS